MGCGDGSLASPSLMHVGRIHHLVDHRCGPWGVPCKARPGHHRRRRTKSLTPHAPRGGAAVDGIGRREFLEVRARPDSSPAVGCTCRSPRRSCPHPGGILARACGPEVVSPALWLRPRPPSPDPALGSGARRRRRRESRQAARLGSPSGAGRRGRTDQVSGGPTRAKKAHVVVPTTSQCSCASRRSGCSEPATESPRATAAA